MTGANSPERPNRRFARLKTRPGDTPTGRRLEIVEAAAAVFRVKGYSNTSMRDIAEQAGILGGSLYHHFTSKEALYAETNALTLSNGAAALERAIAGQTDPWRRLEAAVFCHLQWQLEPSEATMPMKTEFPIADEGLRASLVAHRDRFERLYRALVDDLPLKPGIDRSLYRILLLSMVNSAHTWFRPGRRSVHDVARQIVQIFRHEIPSGGDDADRTSTADQPNND